MKELLKLDFSKSLGNVCFRVYDKFDIILPLKDWRFLCNKRWFTNSPEKAIAEAEFGLYGARKAQTQESAQKCVENCVKDLKDIMGMDIDKECRDLLDSSTSTLLTIDKNGKLVIKDQSNESS